MSDREEVAALPVYELRCNDCENLFDQGDVESPLYECSRCGRSFMRDEADGGTRCPDCNIFAAKVADLSCPECYSGEVEEGEFTPPPPPTPEEEAEMAKQRERNKAMLDEHAERHRIKEARQADAYRRMAEDPRIQGTKLQEEAQRAAEHSFGTPLIGLDVIAASLGHEPEES